ncbi:PaaI family thioesterase [Roseomonas sp. NAR14]|uniref:PaaI family thioesterase n=1 Tax=Roseomonas acroporae TaxID=2937791 RepID=A0A9X1YCH9_9PROT|nr:PaaI family thioesterase [Roseomonas acroporae]MCK8783946.1 PaaI family thioesterase [Roseomonas acroporae]
MQDAHTPETLAAAGWVPSHEPGLSDTLGGPLWSRPDEGLTDGLPCFGFRTAPHHANGHGMVHGGVLLTVIDHSLGMFVRAATGGQGGVTMQLDTQFVGAVTPGAFVVLHGRLVRAARSVVFVQGRLLAGTQEAASASGIWKLRRATPAG